MRTLKSHDTDKIVCNTVLISTGGEHAEAMRQDAFEVVNESLDILVTLLERFGGMVTANGHHKRLLQLLLPLLSDHRVALRKRTISCIGEGPPTPLPPSGCASWLRLPPQLKVRDAAALPAQLRAIGTIYAEVFIASLVRHARNSLSNARQPCSSSISAGQLSGFMSIHRQAMFTDVRSCGACCFNDTRNIRRQVRQLSNLESAESGSTFPPWSYWGLPPHSGAGGVSGRQRPAVHVPACAGAAGKTRCQVRGVPHLHAGSGRPQVCSASNRMMARLQLGDAG